MTAYTHKTAIVDWLTPQEYSTLEVCCNALIPSIALSQNKAEKSTLDFYARSAGDMHVAQRISIMLDQEPLKTKKQLKQLLFFSRRHYACSLLSDKCAVLYSCQRRKGQLSCKG